MFFRGRSQAFKYTAGDLKPDDYVNKLIHQNKGYIVLRNLRGSPPYFEKERLVCYDMSAG